jgi:hypothetical protein
MDALFQYFPLIAVLVVGANLAIFWQRARRLSEVAPDRKAGYHRIIRSLAVYFGGLTILWAIGAMFGLFNVLGMPEAPPSVMARREPTAFDWLLLLAWALVFLRFSVWLYARGGANVLVDHREIFNSFPESARMVKALWALLLLISSASAFHRFVS